MDNDIIDISMNFDNLDNLDNNWTNNKKTNFGGGIELLMNDKKSDTHGLTSEINIDDLLAKVKDKYKKQPMNTIDGLKIEFDKEWVHLRRSNTEPIIRIYAESPSETTANNLAEKIISDMKQFIKN